MPYKDHSAPQNSAEGCTDVKTLTENMPDGVSMIVGTKDGESVVISVRFSPSSWTVAKAKAWLKEHDYKTGIEPAKESQRALCPQCGAEVDATEGDPSEYECSVCGTSMVRFALDTAVIDDMEIFRAGEWKGHKYTTKDLDTMIQNFEAGVIRPYMYISPSGEHDATSHGSRPMLSALAHGWVEKLWRIGDRLKARIKQVPARLAELIESGACKQKSIEVWPDFTTTDGQKRGAALEAILMFGRGLPAVHDLDDAVAVYYTVDRSAKEAKETIDIDADGARAGATDDDEDDTSHPQPEGKTGNQNTDKEYSMTELEKLRVQFEREAEVEKMKARNDLESLKAEHARALQKAETERDEAKAEAEKLRKAANERDRADIEKFVIERIDAKQIEPSAKEATVEHILTLSRDDRAKYTDLLTKLPAAHTDATVPTTEATPPEDGATDDETKKADKIEKIATDLMKKHPELSADEALTQAKDMI